MKDLAEEETDPDPETSLFTVAPYLAVVIAQDLREVSSREVENLQMSKG